MWDRAVFRRVFVPILSRNSKDLSQKAISCGHIVEAFVADVPVACLCGGCRVLMEASTRSLDNKHRRKLIWYSSFIIRLFNRCSQQTAPSVIKVLGSFFVKEYTVSIFKRAETGDCMDSCPALRKVTVANNFVLRHWFEVIGNSVGKWPLVTTYMKQTDRRVDCDSLVVRWTSYYQFHLPLVFFFFLLFWRKVWLGVSTGTRCRVWTIIFFHMLFERCSFIRLGFPFVCFMI